MYTEFLLQALSLIGGLAFFLYGMNVMGDGLTRLSGGRLERILEKLTDNRIKAVLLGAAFLLPQFITFLFRFILSHIFFSYVLQSKQ